jgi:hypothetical protein
MTLRGNKIFNFSNRRFMGNGGPASRLAPQAKFPANGMESSHRFPANGGESSNRFSSGRAEAYHSSSAMVPPPSGRKHMELQTEKWLEVRRERIHVLEKGIYKKRPGVFCCRLNWVLFPRYSRIVSGHKTADQKPKKLMYTRFVKQR